MPLPPPLPVVPVRSSDFDSASAYSLNYYLRRKLGLVPVREASEALSRGTWFHHCAEFDHPDLTEDDLKILLDAYLLQEQEETRTRLAKHGLASNPDVLDDRLEAVEKDAKFAFAMWMAFREAELPCGGTPYQTFFNSSRYRVLDKEPRLIYPLRTASVIAQVPLVAQPDALLYEPGTKEIWIVDFKTTSMDPSERLFLCPNDAQTQHYLYVATHMLAELQEEYDLPEDSVIGGMIHVAIKKPGFNWTRKTRKWCDQIEERKEITRGPNKGTFRTEKKPVGEPKLSNYIAAVKDYILCRGDYEDEAPKIDVSTTTHGEFLGTRITQYWRRLDRVLLASCSRDIPAHWIRPSNLTEFGKLTTYAPFSLLPQEQWEDIIVNDNFEVQHRDPDIDPGNPNARIIPFGREDQPYQGQEEVELEVNS